MGLGASATQTYSDAARTLAREPAANVNAQVRLLAAAQGQREAVISKRRFHVTVRVAHPDGAKAVTSVRVVPDIFGLPPMDLFDDGLHGDGAAGDGVWGGDICPATLRASEFPHTQRRVLPGIVGIPVIATDSQGRRATWTLSTGVFFGPEPVDLWAGDAFGGVIQPLREGDVRAKALGPERSTNKVVLIEGGGGPWTLCWGREAKERNVTGLKYACFEFSGASGASDVSFALVDVLNQAEMAVGTVGPIEPNTPSRFVPLIAGGYLPAMDDKVHVVRIPLDKLCNGTRFMAVGVAGVGLQADKGADGGNYQIGRVWFEN
jgi:hypothetical protein